MKIAPRILVLGLIASAAAIAGPAQLFDRGKYESPEYKVLKSDDDFEIRKYPELVVVTAPMGGSDESDGKAKKGSAKKSSNSAFRMLFKYISGKNAGAEKIAMTTPVFSSPKKGSDGVMSFVVPADVAKAGVPKADNQAVKLSKRAAGKFAVYRYSGRWSEAREKKARGKLEAWMKAQGIAATGSFEKANYDPPFTPGFLRRNEVLVRVK